MPTRKRRQPSCRIGSTLWFCCCSLFSLSTCSAAIASVHPLEHDFESTIALHSAALSSQIYGPEEEGDDSDIRMVADTKWTGGVAVLFQRNEEDRTCYAAFRGPQHGFQWIANTNTQISYARDKEKPHKKCRTVRGYRRLYLQHKKGVKRAFREQLEELLDDCVQNKLNIIFAGHSLGGAVAAVAAVRYSHAKPYLVTFGQPPVFQSASYEEPWKLGRKARRKDPCKHVRNNRYLRFMNTEVVERTTYIEGQDDIIAVPLYERLVYDPFSFLDVLVYEAYRSTIFFEMAPWCLRNGVYKLETHLEDTKRRGNLGWHKGSLYQLPPSVEGDGFLNGLVFHNKGKFRPAKGPNEEVRLSNLWDLEALDQGCNKIPNIHDMKTYLEKLTMLSQDGFLTIPGFLLGFFETSHCNFDSECQDGTFCNEGFEHEMTCQDPSSRPARPSFRGAPTATFVWPTPKPSVSPSPTKTMSPTSAPTKMDTDQPTSWSFNWTNWTYYNYSFMNGTEALTNSTLAD